MTRRPWYPLDPDDCPHARTYYDEVGLRCSDCGTILVRPDWPEVPPLED
jgi:hypothetical protein